MKVIEFCIEACERQDDKTFDALIGMIYGMRFAKDIIAYPVNVFDILDLGKIVKKQDGFRLTPVVFKNGKSGVPYDQIDRLMIQLLNNQRNLTPTEFMIEFLKIHPFEDGNGRIAWILWNLLSDCILNPIFPEEIGWDA